MWQQSKTIKNVTKLKNSKLYKTKQPKYNKTKKNKCDKTRKKSICDKPFILNCEREKTHKLKILREKN